VRFNYALPFHALAVNLLPRTDSEVRGTCFKMWWKCA